MDLDNIIHQFNTLTEDPKSFLSQNENKTVDIKTLLSTIYDLSKKQSKALPKLMVDNFDTEQIWQQIEIQNSQFLPYFNEYIAKHVDQNGQLISMNNSTEDASDTPNNNCPDTSSEPNANASNTPDSESDHSDESNDEILNLQPNSSDSDEDLSKTKDDQSKNTKSADNFFNLKDMEEFLDNEDKKEMLDGDRQNEIDDSDDDSANELNSKQIDYFTNMSDTDDDMENPMYKDFFVKTDEVVDKPSKTTKRNKYLQELELDEGVYRDNEPEQLHENEQSNFDQTQERLKKKITTLERLAVSAKSWQMQGEITAGSRPENSLLENVLEFDMSTRPAPVITEQTTMKLEDIIRQRIQDRVWDSVQRKEKPVENVHDYKKQLVLDGEKSKLSLAQLYEKDYLKKNENENDKHDDKEQDETPAQKEIRQMMATVISKLDALSNYHFTPRLVRPEVKIVTNLAAVSIEEVAPVAASDAALLAPEEVVRGRNRGQAPVGTGERSATDKKRQRRMKKRLQQRRAQSSGNVAGKARDTNTRAKVMKEKNVEKMSEHGLNAVKSSTAFFEHLQEQVKSTIKGKLAEKKKVSKTNLQAKKFKL